MVFFAAVFCQLLLAASTFALPYHRDRLTDHLERRIQSGRQSRPSVTSDSVAKRYINSDTWAGASLVATTSEATYRAVTGNIIVPTPKPLFDESGSYSAALAVSIDGDNCESALFLVIDVNSQGGQASYDAWFQWYPGTAFGIEITINAGDQIRLTVIANSNTTGSVLLENLTTKQQYFESLTSDDQLCRTSANWIVQDYRQGTDYVRLTNFGTVTFSNALAQTMSSVVGPSKADILYMVQDDELIATASTTSNSVTVQYV